MRDLVNTLKHNNVERASQLFVNWPDVLKADPAERPHLDWDSMVNLEDRHVHQVWEIVRGSEPDANLLPVQAEPGQAG